MAKSTKAEKKPATASAKKATKKKSSATETTAKAASTKTATKKAPAKKAPAKKAPAKKAPAKKAPAKKASGKKAPAKKAAAKGGAPNAEFFDKKFLEEQRTMLLEERARYVKSADSLKAEADSLMEGREPGDVQFDEESGEGDTLAVERERDLALSAKARAAVEEIDSALARLENGTYGICTGSHLPIPKERLQAIPWASERVEYKAGGFGFR